jgi:hypothetical protein
MDVFRLPKFSYWFFRSQRDADELVAGKKIGPVIFIANGWTADSPLDVRVFSNCEEVALYLNGKFIERRHPDASRMTTNLKHAPFTFRLGQFQPGELKAVGFIAGRKVTTCESRTPGEANHLTLEFDTSGKSFAAGGKDILFCHASLMDKTGTVVPMAGTPVVFGATGQVRLVGGNPVISEAGIATVLAESDCAKTSGTVFAMCLVRQKDQIQILSAASTPGSGTLPNYQIHYTTDGSEPSNTSPVYLKPVENAAKLQAALFVNGQSVAHAGVRLDTDRANDTAGLNGKSTVQNE